MVCQMLWASLAADVRLYRFGATPGIETATLDNGMKLVVATRGSIPLVDVSIQIDTGSMAAPADAPGIAAFVFGLMEPGATVRTVETCQRCAERGSPLRGGLRNFGFSPNCAEHPALSC